MKYKEMLEAALKAAREIALKAKNEGRPLTAYEVKTFDEHMAKAEEARTKLKEIEESDALFQRVAALDESKKSGSTTAAGQVLSFRGMGRQLKAYMAEHGGFNVKALISTGSTPALAETITSPVVQAKPATGLLDLLPVKFLEGTDEYSYLQQVTRENNAAPVAAGALKPTSVYTMRRVTDHLQVIAHLTEPIPEYWLKDNDSLSQFVSGELGYGLQVAVEDEVLNGDGSNILDGTDVVGQHLNGLLNASGIQTQAYNTSQIRTVRSAITKVEVLGYTASGLVLNPLDWEAIETAADGEDRYFLTPDGSPVDRAARRLWGVPVALSIKVTQGTGVLVSETADGPAAAVVADKNIYTQWGLVGDDFARNQIRARNEGRFGIEVFRPSGVVEIDLAA